VASSCFRTPAQDDHDAPVLTIDGLAAFGGIAVVANADTGPPPLRE
jgi:hypothetical protein